MARMIWAMAWRIGASQPEACGMQAMQAPTLRTRATADRAMTLRVLVMTHRVLATPVPHKDRYMNG